MPEPSPSATPALAPPPRVFCKGCGYALVGLESTKCPECGREFDLGNRRTFARRPPRSWVWRWGRRLLVLALLLLLTAGAGLGRLWWGWRAEQPTIARLRGLHQKFTAAPIGPERLRWLLGERLGYLTERVDRVTLWHLGAAETEHLDLQSLSNIKVLSLNDCELSNSALIHLTSLGTLQDLRLFDLRIEKPDLASLEKLPALSSLVLWGEWIPKSSFERIGRLAHLKALRLYDTGITDADLQYLQGLSALEQLDLRRNPLSGYGLEYLKGLKSLRILIVDEILVSSPAVAKLKQAIPGIQAY